MQTLRNDVLFPGGSDSPSFEVPKVGVPGNIAVFGPNAFSLVMAGKSTCVAAAANGDVAGRVVAIAHGGYVRGRRDTPAPELLDRIATWLGGWDNLVLLGRSVNNHNNDAFRRAREHVASGGGVLVADCPWGWLQLNPGKTLDKDHAKNQFLSEFGLAFTGECCNAPGPFEVAVTLDVDNGNDGVPAITASALRCIPNQARNVLVDNLKGSLRQASLQDLHWPGPDHPVGKDTSNGRACSLLHALASVGDDSAIAALRPGADIFPGIVPGDAPSAPPVLVRCETSSDGGGTVWHSTNRYARPGEEICLLVSAGGAVVNKGQWRLRIGCHSDDIGGSKLKRMPSITTLSDVIGGSAACVSPFGGLVFIEQCNAKAPSIECTLTGGVAAPCFALGVAGTGKFCDGPAPWGEVSGNLVSLCLPRTHIVKANQCGDLQAAVCFWDSVVRHHQQLASPPYGKRRERIVTDVQLSCGYMHSGYPIMAHLDFAARALNVVQLVSEGSWGMFHELGHNMQRRWWTWDGTTEVTVNLFTMYTMENLIGKCPKRFALLGTPKGRDKVQKWVDSGRPRAKWNKDPFLALYMYSQLIDAFGWSALQKVLHSYEEDPPKFNVAKASGDKKMSEWASRYCGTVGRNLVPFFEAWGFTVPPPTDSLPPWTCTLP